MPAKAPTTAPAAWQKANSASSSAQGPVPASLEGCVERLRASIREARPVALACQPSLEGVLAGVGVTYLAHAKSGQARLASARGLQPALGEAVVALPAIDDGVVAFSRRVLLGFARHVRHECRRRKAGACPPTCGVSCLQRLVLATASDDPTMPEVVHRYMRLGFAEGPRVHDMIADPRVAAYDDLARYVSGECEHTRQFVRFSHMADGSFAASYMPSANTIPLTADHFARRMLTERFVLVDPRHRVAAFHEADERTSRLVTLDATLARGLAERHDLADDERYVRAMWQRFYQGSSLPGRDRAQRGYDLRTKWMPQRLWGGLTELGPGQAADAAPIRYAGTPDLTALQGQSHPKPEHGLVGGA